jgi:hypothetical protein
MPKEKTKLTIASTTSIQNSGLFDILIPAYEKSKRYDVRGCSMFFNKIDHKYCKEKCPYTIFWECETVK